jgi:hypothetical protein
MSDGQEFKPIAMRNQNHSLKAFEPKHRFLEVDTMSQNLHPNSSLHTYNTIMNSTMPNKIESKSKNISKKKKVNAPRDARSKQSTIRLCSSKKKKEEFGPRKIKCAQSSKFANVDQIEPQNLFKNMTQKLLSKYELENYGHMTVLGSKEKSILTHKALSSAVKDSRQ